MSIESLDPVTPTFPCQEPGCDRAFPSKNGLQGHMIAHRPDVACPECGKTYKSPGALGNHRKSKHGVASVNGTKTPVTHVTGWHADDIFQSVIRLLWPDGGIPTDAVLPLIQWRDDTRVFLEKIQ